jgi:hypothetical protein
MDFPERDWKHLRKVHRLALERYCERVLQECATILNDPGRTAHERYLELFRVTRERDEELAGAFDDMRRSRAHARLVAMCRLGVVTDEEMEGFTPETRGIVERALSISW